MSDRRFKVTVTFERREDGGLRAWSADVPGLVLSHTDIDGVLSDVKTAIETILSYRLGGHFEVEALDNLRDALEAEGVVSPVDHIPTSKDYVAYCH